MTFKQATKKAQRLTANGVATQVVKNSHREGGYQTKNLSNVLAHRVRYSHTAKGRARTFRHRAKQRTGMRLNVTADDIAALRESQGNICPLTLKPLASIPVSNDHSWDDVDAGAGCLRGVIHRAWNSVLGRDDIELFQAALRLTKYANKRMRALVLRACTKKGKRRVSQKHIKQVIADVARSLA